MCVYILFRKFLSYCNGNRKRMELALDVYKRQAQASDILASAKTESSREKNAAELGIRLTADNKSVAEFRCV